MRLSVLALDYDGTIAHHGALDDDVRAAIGEARAAGIAVVIVTGRILDDLRRAAGDLRFVDAVVAENGAVLAFPERGRSTVLGRPAPPALVDALRAAGVAIEVGVSVIEADAAAAPAVLDIIRRLELPQTLMFNRQRLMVLPSGINKATGLREALRTLRWSPHNTLGIGDAENDHDLLDLCEIGAAVAWGSDALKARADEIIAGDGPPAVADYIRRVVQARRLAPERVSRRQITLGRDAAGQPVSLAVRGRNVLVIGDPKSGKSWVAGLLAEQLILRHYSVCVIDPEGDYAGLEALPRVVVLSGGAEGPTPRELRTALKYPDVNLVLDLSGLQYTHKWHYTRALLRALAEIRRARGIPHRILLDEAHYVLDDIDDSRLLDQALAGYTLVTYQPARLHPRVVAASEAVITTRLTDAREIEVVTGACKDGAACQQLLRELELGDAVLLPTAGAGAGRPRRIRLASRVTSHVRHRQKYLDIPVPLDRAFFFAGDGETPPCHAGSLREFVAAVSARRGGDLAVYLDRGDFSRWIGGVFGDAALAADLRRLEDERRAGRLADAAGAVVHAIESRYELAAR